MYPFTPEWPDQPAKMSYVEDRNNLSYITYAIIESCDAHSWQAAQLL